MKRILICISVLILAANCRNKSQENATAPASPSNAIRFSNEQIKLAEIKWGKPVRKDISDVVEASGTVEVPPQNKITVSLPLSGIISRINLFPGAVVRKGEVIAEVQHPDFIKLQQEYIDAKSRYEYEKEDYKRQGELTLEQATSIKKMQATEAEFKSLEAKMFSLRKQLELLDVNVENLTADKISPVLQVKSPSDGYITGVYANHGKFMEAGTKICELIDKSHLHLELHVFEKDLAYLKPGLKVSFKLAAVPSKVYTATLETIGQSIDDTDRSIMLHAHVNSESTDLKTGMFVNASIYCNSRFVYTLPVTSLVNTDKGFYIYEYHDGMFYRQQVKTGREDAENVEIREESPQFMNKDIVLSGAYYIEAEWKKRLE